MAPVLWRQHEHGVSHNITTYILYCATKTKIPYLETTPIPTTPTSLPFKLRYSISSYIMERHTNNTKTCTTVKKAYFFLRLFCFIKGTKIQTYFEATPIYTTHTCCSSLHAKVAYYEEIINKVVV